MIPSVGRIVNIRLSDSCALRISNRREVFGGRIPFDGNPVKEGDIFPMIITKVWDKVPTETSVVQGQIFLDGNDIHWASSVEQGTENGQWFSPVGE